MDSKEVVRVKEYVELEANEKVFDIQILNEDLEYLNLKANCYSVKTEKSEYVCFVHNLLPLNLYSRNIKTNDEYLWSIDEIFSFHVGAMSRIML